MRKIKKRSLEERQRILKGYSESGMKAAQYCQKKGIPKSTLMTWIKKDLLPKRREKKFIKIQGLESKIPESITINTPKGHKIEMPVSVGEKFIGKILMEVLQ